MLAGGDMQILTAKIAKKNNYKLLVTDKNKNAPCRHIADKFYDVDVVDIKKNYQIIKKLKIFKLKFFYLLINYYYLLYMIVLIFFYAIFRVLPAPKAIIFLLINFFGRITYLISRKFQFLIAFVNMKIDT
jgi:hypothetical protein